MQFSPSHLPPGRPVWRHHHLPLVFVGFFLSPFCQANYLFLSLCPIYLDSRLPRAEWAKWKRGVKTCQSNCFTHELNEGKLNWQAFVDIEWGSNERHLRVQLEGQLRARVTPDWHLALIEMDKLFEVQAKGWRGWKSALKCVPALASFTWPDCNSSNNTISNCHNNRGLQTVELILKIQFIVSVPAARMAN